MQNNLTKLYHSVELYHTNNVQFADVPRMIIIHSIFNAINIIFSYTYYLYDDNIMYKRIRHFFLFHFFNSLYIYKNNKLYNKYKYNIC